jgi:hypothetical protein
MGEMNEKVNYQEAGEIIVDWLAQYLYENFEQNPSPMHDDDPRHVVIGMTEPWESAGKRVRERWQLKATEMIMDFSSKVLGPVTG